MLLIRDVQTFVTHPVTQNLVVVKVLTSEPELFGLGCATFTQRCHAVVAAIEHHLKPLVIGRPVAEVAALWNLMMTNGYWRNGPVLNNAVAGIDIALWDIKGKLANMPLYDLLGGKHRPAAVIYRHVSGPDFHAVHPQVEAMLEQGVDHIRIQQGADPVPPDPGSLRPNAAGYGGTGDVQPRTENAHEGAYYDPKAYMRGIEALLNEVRDAFGQRVELLHDIHERLHPAEAVQLARRLEPVDLFFLEDPLAPEDLAWFDRLRQATTTPLAMGELFVHPAEWRPLVQNRLIDFIRMHVSAIGGVTPALRAAALADANGVRTAWHGPKDVSPVGHAANLHLDLAAPNFGIQEFSGFTELEMQMFPGCPTLQGGALYPNDKPGLGIDFDENLAASHPPQTPVIQWTQTRRPDGGLARP